MGAAVSAVGSVDARRRREAARLAPSIRLYISATPTVFEQQCGRCGRENAAQRTLELDGIGEPYFEILRLWQAAGIRLSS